MKWPSDIETLENELIDHIAALKKKFIDSYIPAQPEHTPDIFNHDVQAYCVLAHASFEHFIERVSICAVEEAVERWINKREASDLILALCTFYEKKIVHSPEKEQQETCFKLLKSAIESAKTSHSNAIFMNHGFSLEYLRKSLTPISVNVPKAAKFEASLKSLTDARGTFAHTLSKDANYFENKGRSKATKVMTPEGARDAVEDCLELCTNISEQVKNLFSVAVIDHSVREKFKLLRANCAKQMLVRNKSAKLRVPKNKQC